MKYPLRAARMILLLGALAFAACGQSSSIPAIADWHANGVEAKQVALQSNRLLLVAFMGSDWSQPSQAIRKDILDTQAFKNFADANLVLVMADFPRNSTVPPDLAKQYADMARSAQVDRLPVFMLVDPRNGLAFTRISDFGGNADAFIAQIQNGLDNYKQTLQQSAQVPVAIPVAAAQPLPSSPAFSQPPAAAPANLPGLPSFPGSLPTPEQLMNRVQQTPPQTQ